MAKYKNSSSYGMKSGKGSMGHEKSPSKCNAFAAQKKDLSKVQRLPMDYRGTPDQAFGYKYQETCHETGDW